MSTHNTGGSSSVPLDLAALIFSAKIDYVSLRTPGKLQLPDLQGTVRWARSENWKRLTIHDPTVADIARILDSVGPLPISELETCVDVRCHSRVKQEDRQATLESVLVDVFARQLSPQFPADLATSFRAFYRRFGAGYLLRPFNLALPKSGDQQLHGLRCDPIQVKCYLKTIDQGARVPEFARRARVEVRLSGEGLSTYGLNQLTDLAQFKFRRHLMPFFRHMEGTRIRSLDKKNLTPLHRVIADKIDEINGQEWNRVGVGAFIGRGKRSAQSVRMVRNSGVNDRIGQALTRLEKEVRLLSVCISDARSKKDEPWRGFAG